MARRDVYDTRRNGLDEEELAHWDNEAAMLGDGEDSIDVTRVHVPDVITLTARLAQILALEADLLEQMKISKVSELQKEKITLTHALDAIRKQVERQPELLDDISDAEREDLRDVVGVFNQVLAENYKRLGMARAANQEVVRAITELVAEQSHGGIYDKKGSNDRTGESSLSVTLNERV